MNIVDARGLHPPEPFERVVDALSELALGDRLKLIINQEPRPQYRFLERNRHAYHGEDQCRARVKNAAQNFAILRRIVVNLLRADPTTKVGAKTKRLKAGADDRYRAHILRLVALQ